MSIQQRAATIGLGGVFTLVFYWAYVRYLHPYFDYAGYRLVSRDASFLVLSVVLAVAPLAFSRGVPAISSLIAFIVYFVLYVPIIVTFALASTRSVPELILVEAVFSSCMSVLFLADAIIVISPVALRLRGNAMPWVLLGTVVGAAYLVVVYRGSLAFPSFGQELYVQRQASVEIGEDVVTRYLSAWLANLFAPLSLAYGLATRRPVYFAGGVLACVVLYMAQAAKITILLPLVLAGFYYAFRGRRMRQFAHRFGLGLAAALVVMLMTAGLGDLPFLASSILVSRTIGNGGLLTMSYYDFFSHHPQTSFSHLNLIAELTRQYPYGDNGLGQVVGQYYWSADMNANANFWATDGIAALGLAGVPVATVALFILLVVMNSLTRRTDLVFVTLCFIPFTQYLLNASLFSSLWSGGGILVLGLFLVNSWPESLVVRSEADRAAVEAA